MPPPRPVSAAAAAAGDGAGHGDDDDDRRRQRPATSTGAARAAWAVGAAGLLVALAAAGQAAEGWYRVPFRSYRSPSASLAPHVFAKRGADERLGTQVLAGEGEAAHLAALSRLRLGAGSAVRGRLREGETQLYFGLAGRCSLAVSHDFGGHREQVELRRGVSALVRPGTPHDLTSSAESCSLVAASVLSGAWLDGGANGSARLRVADDAELPHQRTAHESNLLSKRVHLKGGLVPGLLQVSVSRFEKGAVCELHSHPTATEVYVNFAGEGCHLKAVVGTGAAQRDEVYDLTGGHADVLNPGTPHDAWNAGAGPCENFNIMLADPHEP